MESADTEALVRIGNYVRLYRWVFRWRLFYCLNCFNTVL